MAEMLHIALTVVAASDIAHTWPSHQVYSFFVLVELEAYNTVFSTDTGNMVWDHTFHFDAHQTARVSFSLYRSPQTMQENSLIGEVSMTIRELLEMSMSVDSRNISISIHTPDHNELTGRLIVKVAQRSAHIDGTTLYPNRRMVTASETQLCVSTIEPDLQATSAGSINVSPKRRRYVANPRLCALRLPLENLIRALLARLRGKRNHPSLAWESIHTPPNPFCAKEILLQEMQSQSSPHTPDTPLESCPPYDFDKQTSNLAENTKLRIDCSTIVSDSSSGSPQTPQTPLEQDSIATGEMLAFLHNGEEDMRSRLHESPVTLCSEDVQGRVLVGHMILDNGKEGVRPRLRESPITLRREDVLEQYDSLIDLGKNNHDRYNQRGDLEDLDQTIHYYQRALRLSLPGLPDHSAALNRLSDLFWERFQKRGHIVDLQSSIEIDNDASELCPLDRADCAPMLMTLAVDLIKRFRTEGNFTYLQRAMELHADARNQRAKSLAPNM